MLTFFFIFDIKFFGMMSKGSILAVDPDAVVLGSLRALLLDKGYAATGVHSAAAAKKALSQEHFSLVLTEVNLPDGSGFDLLEAAQNPIPNGGNPDDRKRHRSKRGRGHEKGSLRLSDPPDS